MRGGTFTFNGRAQTDATESATLSLAEGLNVINVTTGGTGVNSAVLTANLSRPTGSAATAIFGQAGGGVSQNGQIGSNPRMLLTTPTLTNDVIPWAVIGREFASYIPGLGVAQLNANGAMGYSNNTLATAMLPTENIRMTAGVTLTGAGTLTVNTLNLPGAGSATVNLGGRTLNLGAGSLMIAPNADNTVVTFNTGNITSTYANGIGSGTDLNLFHMPYAGTNRTSLISAVIADSSGTSPLRLVVTSSEGVCHRQPLDSRRSEYLHRWYGHQRWHRSRYDGWGNPSRGVTINNGALATAIAGQVTPGTIDPANVVTLNGNGRLDLSGATTLAGLVFNNNGGATGPVVNTFVTGAGTDGRGTLTLTGASALVANSSNVTTTSGIVGRLDTSTGATLTVNPITVDGDSVAPLQATVNVGGWLGSTGTITKAGTGVLNLNSQQIFTGQLNVTAGGVNFGFSSNTGLAGTLQSGSRYSNLNLGANTWLNLANTDGTIGSLSGSGTVINVIPNSSALAAGRT